MLEVIVWLLLLKDGQIFLLQRSTDTGYEHSLVGGHVQSGESIRQALKREVMEEIGVEVEEEKLIFKYALDRKLGDKHKVHFFFTISDWKGQPYNKEPQKHLSAEWCSLKNLPPTLGPLATRAINSLNNQELYGEYGWP